MNSDEINEWLDHTNEVTGDSIKDFLSDNGYGIFSWDFITLLNEQLQRLNAENHRLRKALNAAGMSDRNSYTGQL